MENETHEQGPNPIAFRLVWGLVVVVAIGCVWVVWSAYQGEVDRFLRVRMGTPTPELAAALPNGSQELIRRTDAGIEANYQTEPKQPAVGPKRPGSGPRMIWLGGSTVHGGSRDITRLEEAAGRAGELLGMESLNFGGIGMDTVSIAAILDDVLSLQPDVLVLYTGHNEFGNAVFTGRYGDAQSAHFALLRALLRKSRLFQSLELRLRGPETLTLPSEANEKQYTVDAATRAEIYWRFEERLRHIVSRASDQGVTVVVATPGTYVPGIDTTIGVGKIRGVESFGMMCSEREMELSDEHDGIIELPSGEVGQSFVDYLAENDPSKVA